MRRKMLSVDEIEHFCVGHWNVFVLNGLEEGVIDLNIEDESVEVALQK